MIDRETIDRIYAAANIVDIIGDYVTLKRKGVNYQACCPFHNEKTPSFVVSPTKGLFKCFGCGKGGNAVTFVMEHESLTYPEALKMVAKRYGIEVNEKELTPEEVERNDNRESMFALNSWVSEYFRNFLHRDDEGISVGMSYFRQKRQISDAMIQRFELGFCPSRGDQMSREAIASGYKEEFLCSTGLSIKRESDGRLYDRFRDRVIFPIHNISGRVVGFGGRTLRTDKSVAKYQNSPESEIYSKKRELYGLFFAKKSIQQLDYAIMVEGYTDVISMHQSGVENVVASSGTSLTIDQIRLLSRFTKNITVIYDGDSAGIHASLRGIDMILQEGLNVRVVLLPEGEDPDSFARSHTAEELRDYIRANEEDFLTFKAKLLLRDVGDDPIRKATVVSDMVQTIAHVADNIQRSVYTKECAKVMNVDENVLINEVVRKRLATTGDRETDDFVRRQLSQRKVSVQVPDGADYPQQVMSGSSVETLERELTKYLLKWGGAMFEYKDGKNFVNYNVADVIFGELDADELSFTDASYNAILKCYRDNYLVDGERVEVPMHLFLNHHDPAVCNVAVDILTDDDNYIASQIWSKKEIHVDTDDQILAVGVPKAITLYKSKVIEKLMKELNAQLHNPDITDEQTDRLLQRFAALNRAKVSISKKLQRLIL